MKYLQKFFLILLSYFSLFMFFNLELVHSSFSSYETQIFHWSNESRVIKLQEVFKWLDLYSWNINWNFNDIKQNLIDYQIKVWIIENEEDHWAWYFWVKTIDALENEFWNRFLELKEKFLKIDKPENWERYFYVTAYYTPIAWQKRYTTWTFAWDLRLNTQWDPTIAASWKKVVAWLIAAPRNYAFWTKIYLEWIGIWSVEDRWWAIVNSWERWNEYDRLDIWMWYWDEWLERALKWWKRKVKWFIVDSSSKMTIEFDESPVEKYKNLQLNPNEPENNSVMDLQTLLKEIGLYNWEINWDFETIRYILIKYQLDNWIINSQYDTQAWYFWPRTFAAMREEYWNEWNWFFIEKYISTPESNKIIIPQNRLNDLYSLRDNLDIILNRKYKWDILKINNFKIRLSNSLDELINSNISQNQKIELSYFKNIL